MPDFEDFARLVSFPESANIDRNLQRVAQERKAIALAASGVKADPNWTKYADALEAQRITCTRNADTCDHRLLTSGVMDQVAYANLKLDQVRWRAKEEAFKFAIYYINQLSNVDSDNK
jgi:hypothetical protein